MGTEMFAMIIDKFQSITYLFQLITQRLHAAAEKFRLGPGMFQVIFVGELLY